MTRKKLVYLVESLAKGDFSKTDLRRKSLDDCYSSYSSRKLQAYWHDVNEFTKIVKEFERCNNNVERYIAIPSYNTMMFTLFQCVYFWKDGEMYAAVRYDTSNKTIESYFVSSELKRSIYFDFDCFKEIYLDKISN